MIASASLFSNEYERRLDLLEAEIETLKADQLDISKSMDSSYLILEKVETKSIIDRLNFMPELNLRFDKLKYSVGKFEPVPTPSPDGLISRNRDDFSKNFEWAGSMRFRLTMNTDLTEDVSFRGRVVIQHSTQSNQRLCILSHDIKSADATTGFDIDRAYIDYKLNRNGALPMVLSFGSLPTTGGDPMQYAAQSPRESLYPALVFDINTIGVSLTAELSEYTGRESFVRLIAAKAYTLTPAMYPYQCNRENIDNATIIGGYFDMKFDDTYLLSMGFNRMQSLKAHPYLGPDISANHADDLGDMLTFGIGVDGKNIVKSGLTLFVHAAMSHPHPNGNEDDYKGIFTNSDYASGPMLGEDGYAVYTGFNYQFRKNWQFGMEYNHGSRYWFAATQGANDMYNKLATRGDVGEGYAVWHFHRYLYAKAGYMLTYEAYTGSGWHFGTPIKKGGHQQVGYVQLNARF